MLMSLHLKPLTSKVTDNDVTILNKKDVVCSFMYGMDFRRGPLGLGSGRAHPRASVSPWPAGPGGTPGRGAGGDREEKARTWPSLKPALPSVSRREPGQ